MEEVNSKGAFVTSLQRNNKTIREDRAANIAEDALIIYKRSIEDLEYKIRKAKQIRENALDLSPTNAMSLMVASEFDAKGFQEQDLALSLEIRNDSIKIAVLKARFAYLFEGGEIPSDIVVNDGVEEV
jgi:hypothetical protein